MENAYQVSQNPKLNSMFDAYPSGLRASLNGNSVHVLNKWLMKTVTWGKIELEVGGSIFGSTGILNGERILRTGSCELENKFLQQLLRYRLCILISLLARWIRTRLLACNSRGPDSVISLWRRPLMAATCSSVLYQPSVAASFNLLDVTCKVCVTLSLQSSANKQTQVYHPAWHACQDNHAAQESSMESEFFAPAPASSRTSSFNSSCDIGCVSWYLC